MSAGFDSTSDLTQCASAIKESGYEWVGRYLDTGHTSEVKTYLSASEAKSLSGAGLYIVSIFEYSPTDSTYFTTAQGEADGNATVAAAKSVGQPLGTPIYFTVDYNAEDLSQIEVYFEAVRDAVRAAGYFVGVYGSGNVCSDLIGAGYVSYTWLSQSTGWSKYTTWFPRATIVQLDPPTNIKVGSSENISIDGVDLDLSNGDAGGWIVT